MQSSTTNFTSNQWVHLMISIDKSNSNVSFYGNGNLIETHSNTEIAFNYNIKNESMLLGSSFVQTKSNYQGYIDDFTVFDKSLTTTEVNTVYNSYSSIESLPLNNWSHIAVNYDKVRKESHISINGVEVGKYENYDTVINNNTSNIVFGGNGFVGELGEVTIFERPLSTNEINYLATNEERHLGQHVIFEATFKNLSSTEMVDSSSNNIHAALTNTASYIVGHTTNSKALAFNGTQTATLTNSQPYNNFDQMTINCVMKHDLSSIATLIQKDSVFKLYIDTTGELKFDLFDTGGVPATYVSSTVLIVSDTYANIVVEVDKHESFVKFYKDHTLTDTYSSISINMPQDNTNDIVMGPGLKGGMSYMQIDLGYNAYTTAFDVDYSATVFANYTFDESGGTTAIDKSSNANHGTFVNNPVRSFGTYDVQSKGLKLDGTLNQSVTIPGTPYSSVDLNTMTLSAWVNTVDNAAHKSIVSKGSEFDFAINADGKMEFTAGAVTCTSSSKTEISLAFVPGTWVLLARQTIPTVLRTIDEWKYENWNESDPTNDNYSIIPELNDPTVYNAITQNGTLKYHMKLIYYKSDGTVDITLEFKQTSHPFLTEAANVSGGQLVSASPSPINPFNNALALSSSTSTAVWDASPSHNTWYYNVGHRFISELGIPGNTFTTGECAKYECYIYIDNAIAIPSNPWNHLAVTLDEYNGEVKFYKNGENTDTFAPNPFVNIPMTTTNLTIGSNLTGELDNVMIHKGVVDFATETQLYTIPDSMYAPQTITSESWTHVAAVYNKEKNMVTMYQDGQHTGSFENYLTDFTDVGVNNSNIFIGTTGDNTTFYDGIVDDVRVYKSALTTENIGELYAMYDQTMISYIDKTSVSTVFMYNDGVADINIGSVTIGDGVGTDAIQYYAFAMDTNRLSGNQDMQFFIDQIDIIPTTFYKTNKIATTSTSWNIGTLNKVISTNLITEADVSLKSSVYVYVLAQNTVTYAIDYYKQQIPRSYLPAAISMETYLDQTTNTIKVSSGSVTSVVRYCILVFVDQPALSDVQTFVKDNIYNQITSEGGNYLNVGTYNIPVYVFRAHYDMPPSHDLPTSVSLNKAFVSTSDVNSYGIPTYPDLYQFTTYIVAFDMVGNVIEDITYTPTYTPLQPPTLTTQNIASVGAPKDIMFNYTNEIAKTVVNSISFGLESVTVSDTANANVYAMVSTRDLYYDIYANDLNGLLKEIATIQDSLTPILTMSAGATVSSTPFTITQAVNDTGSLVDLDTVSTGYLYAWAHTLGSVNARSFLVQQVLYDTISVYFKYNPGGPSSLSGANVNTLRFYIADEAGILSDPYLDIKSAVDSWLEFSQDVSVVSNKIYLVWEVVHGTHVPDNGIYDITISKDGEMIVQYTFTSTNTYDFTVQYNNEDFNINDMVVIGTGTSTQESGVKFTNTNAVNVVDYTMISSPGVYYLHYDGSVHLNDTAGYRTFVMSPLITIAPELLNNSAKMIINNPVFDIFDWEINQTDYTKDVDYYVNSDLVYYRPITDQAQILYTNKILNDSGDWTIVIDWMMSEGTYSWVIGTGDNGYNPEGFFRISQYGDKMTFRLYNSDNESVYFRNFGTFRAGDPLGIRYREVFIWHSDNSSLEFHHYEDDFTTPQSSPTPVSITSPFGYTSDFIANPRYCIGAGSPYGMIFYRVQFYDRIDIDLSNLSAPPSYMEYQASLIMDANRNEVLIHVDAQDPDGYILNSNDEVQSVKDISENVAFPHMSTLVGKTVTTDPSFSVVDPMKLTTLNGYPAFEGFIRFGRPLSNPPGDEFFDVMKRNTDESYSIFVIFSCSSLNQWGHVFNFIQSNDIQGVSLTRDGINNQLTMAIAKVISPDVKFPTSTQFNVDYANVVLLTAARFNRTSVNVETGIHYYTYHMKIINMSEPDMPVEYDTSVENVEINSSSNAALFLRDGGQLYLGGDELMNSSGNSQMPIDFKIGECIAYNNFISDSDTDILLNHLKEKWKATADFIVQSSGPSYTTDGLMFVLDPTDPNILISYHPTETIEIDSSFETSFNTTTNEINGRPCFTGFFDTNEFSYTQRSFTVVMVVKITSLSTGWNSWFQYDVGQTNPALAHDRSFKIEGNNMRLYHPDKFPYTSSIGGQHSNWYTEPQWEVTSSLVDTPLVFYCSYDDEHAMNFRVYDLSGNLVHDGQMLGTYTISTVMIDTVNPITGSSRARLGRDGYSTANGVYGHTLFYNKRLNGSERDGVIDYLLNLYGGSSIPYSFTDERRYPQPTVTNGDLYDLTSISPLISEYTEANKKYGTFTIYDDGVYTLTSADHTNADYRYPILNVFQTEPYNNLKIYSYSIVTADQVNTFTFDVIIELPRPILLKKVDFLTRNGINRPSNSEDFPLFARVFGIDESNNETILGTRDFESEYPDTVFDPTGNGQQFYIKNPLYNVYHKDVLVIMNNRYYNDTTRDITMYKKFRIGLNHKRQSTGTNTRIDGRGLYIFGEESL